MSVNQEMDLLQDQPCTGLENFCDSGLSCDSATKTCLLAAGGSCAGNNTNKCVTGTDCDNDLCQQGPGKNCTDGQTGQCVTGTLCDLSLCQLTVLIFYEHS
ncbi:hypothetical protein ACOMHN_008562 [Nucella lapillus]